MSYSIRVISLIFLIYSYFSPISLFAKEDRELYLLPNQSREALSAMKREFQSAKKSIKISIYSFTNKKLAKSLKKAANRGVKIEIVFDDKESRSHRGKSVIAYLAKYKNITATG